MRDVTMEEGEGLTWSCLLLWWGVVDTIVVTAVRVGAFVAFIQQTLVILQLLLSETALAREEPQPSSA